MRRLLHPASAAMALVMGTVAALAWPAHSPASRVAQGGRIYAANCAACHGAVGQGQPGWQRPGPDGTLPAPPHDASGHTWQHSDAQLVALVMQGPAGGGAPPGYRSNMPAFAGRLSRAQVVDVIDWIKAQWPDGIRAYQAAQNPDGPGLQSVPGDWQFPATCTPGWVSGRQPNRVGKAG